MGAMMLAMLVIALAIGFLTIRLVTRQLPSTSASDPERRLAEQDERIELLEDEVGRLREQANFTEKLLTERSRDASEENPQG